MAFSPSIDIAINAVGIPFRVVVFDFRTLRAVPGLIAAGQHEPYRTDELAAYFADVAAVIAAVDPAVIAADHGPPSGREKAQTSSPYEALVTPRG